MGTNVTYRFECDSCGHIEISDAWPDECPKCVKNGQCKETQNRREEKRNAPVSRTPTDDPSGGYKYSGYYGSDWDSIREMALENDDYMCRNCGLTNDTHKTDGALFGGGLHVHHITPAHEFDDEKESNTLENLACLCADCHRKAENGKIKL